MGKFAWHASIGWACALTLAEIAPDRANAILARGLAYGQSRVVCGVHWKSDVEAGRVVGASTVSRLRAGAVFAAQLSAARKEIAAARAAGLKSPLDCPRKRKLSRAGNSATACLWHPSHCTGFSRAKDASLADRMSSHDEVRFP